MRIVRQVGMMVGSAALATAATAIVVFVGPASASGVVSGCPEGYQLLSVTTLTADGYHLPALIDDPSVDLGNPNSNAWVSQPGNGDGFVCGRPEGNRTTLFGGQLYLFVDNQSPAAS